VNGLSLDAFFIVFYKIFCYNYPIILLGENLMDNIKKHIILKANNIGFYTYDSLNVDTDSTEKLIKNLNVYFKNNIIKSGINPETIYLVINNYKQHNFEKPNHDNFCAMFYDHLSYDLNTYYHNTILTEKGFSSCFMNIIKSYILNQKLAKSSFLFYAEPFKYMTLLQKNRTKEAIDSIFEENTDLSVLCSCAFYYGIQFFLTKENMTFIENEKFMRELNKSKAKVNFFSHLYSTNDSLFDLFKRKIIFKEKEFLYAFKLVVKNDLSSDLKKVENFVKDAIFINNFSTRFVDSYFDILDDKKYKEEIYINNIKKIIKMTANINNF
tara:strand:- start:726 stop:1700 length:975 start_codon:yes stop_codon:yes gene_type:complete